MPARPKPRRLKKAKRNRTLFLRAQCRPGKGFARVLRSSSSTSSLFLLIFLLILLFRFLVVEQRHIRSEEESGRGGSGAILIFFLSIRAMVCSPATGMVRV